MDLMPVNTMDQRQHHRNAYADTVPMSWPTINSSFDADSSLDGLVSPSKSLLPKLPRNRKSSSSNTSSTKKGSSKSQSKSSNSNTTASTKKGNGKSQSKPTKRGGAFSKLSRALFRERDPNVTFSKMSDIKETKELETTSQDELDHKQLMTTTIDSPVKGSVLTSDDNSSRWLAGHQGDFNFQADFSQCDNKQRTKPPMYDDLSLTPSPLSKFTRERLQSRLTNNGAGGLSPSPTTQTHAPPSSVHHPRNQQPPSPPGRKSQITSAVVTPMTQDETPNHSISTSMEQTPRKGNRTDELKKVQTRLVDRLGSSPGGGSKRPPKSPTKVVPTLKPPRSPSTPRRQVAILERLGVASYMNDKGDVVESGSELHLKILERLENTSDEQLEVMHTQDPSFTLNEDQLPEVAVGGGSGSATKNETKSKLPPSSPQRAMTQELYSDPLLSASKEKRDSRNNSNEGGPPQLVQKSSTLSEMISNEDILSEAETKSTGTGTETKSYFSFPTVSAAGPADRSFKSMSEAFLDLVSNNACGAGHTDQQQQQQPVKKDSLREKVVALEAGWNGLRETLSEKILEVEDSLKQITIQSLLPFANEEEGDGASSNRDYDNDSDTYAPRVQTVSEDTATELSVSTSCSESRRTYDSKASTTFSKASTTLASKTTVTRAEEEVISDEEIVLEIIKDLETNRKSSQDKEKQPKHIISIEHDVHPLQRELEDISIIVEQRGNSSSGQNNSSREDSEGGKVILDPTEWDPVTDSPEGWKLDITDPIRNGKSKRGPSIRSPTSVVGGF